MPFFNNTWFRHFAGGFLCGASLVAVARATGRIKDLKLEAISDRSAFSENQTWVIVGAVVGIVGGVLALGVAATKLFVGKTSTHRATS